MVVKEIMTESPASVDAASPISEVLDTINELEIRHVPVVDNGVLVGLVSDRDLRSFNLPAMVEFNNPEAASKRLEAPVSSIMRADVETVGVETEIADVIQLMVENKFGAIPVCDQIEGKLVGIVSYIDVLRAAEDLF